MPIATGATFEIHTLSDETDLSAVKATNPDSVKPVFLAKPAIISTKDVATVTLSETEVPLADGTPSGHREPEITVELTPQGAAKMAAATAGAAGESVAVVVNGKVIATPRLHSPIKKSFRIAGQSDRITSAYDALTEMDRGATGRTSR